MASPSGSASPSPQEAAILSQYRAFFASITRLSKEKYEVRYPAMQKLAVDPELTQVMGGIAASQRAGEVLYGDVVLRPTILTVDGGTALLKDCQDTSQHGRMKVSTGKKVTVGRVNDLAKVTMKRGTDGVWRMATIAYAPAGSC